MSGLIGVAGLGIAGPAWAVTSVSTLKCTGRTVVSVPASPEVFEIGDSLTVGDWCYATKAARASLRFAERKLSVRVDARVGRLTSPGVDVLEGAYPNPLTLPGTVVFALGTNDAVSGIPLVSYMAQLGAVVDFVGPSRRLYLVTIAYTGARVPLRRRVAAFNIAARQLAASHPNVHVVDFGVLAAAHRGWFAADGVHLGPIGYSARADLIARAIQVCTVGCPVVAPPQHP